jgi:hypothetical protein
MASRIVVALLFLSTWISGGVAVARLAHDGHDHEMKDKRMKIDQDGRLNLSEDMMLRQIQIRKGEYVVTHVVEGTEHWFTFSRIVDPAEEDRATEPVKVKASRLPTRETLKTSFVYAWPEEHEYRIIKIQLAHEAVEYLF